MNSYTRICVLRIYLTGNPTVSWFLWLLWLPWLRSKGHILARGQELLRCTSIICLVLINVKFPMSLLCLLSVYSEDIRVQGLVNTVMKLQVP
jgi:hypothetical protein